MTRSLSNMSIHLCLVLALAAVGATRADDALPSQDEGLAGALENHPEVVAAKAKVAMANAELYGKRIEVSRQVIGLYGNLKKLDAQIDVAKVALVGAKQSAKGGANDQSTKELLQKAEAQLVQTISQREQAEKELRLIIGKAAPSSSAADDRLGLAQSAESPKPGHAPRQMPQGPMVDKIRVVGQKSIKLDYAEVPLMDVLAQLSDSSGVMFSMQKAALENAGLGTDMPINLSTDKVRLQDAIQAFEDALPELQFVVRDYGVLLTTREYAEEHGYIPLLELLNGEG
jgi:hypothetical protein